MESRSRSDSLPPFVGRSSRLLSVSGLSYWPLPPSFPPPFFLDPKFPLSRQLEQCWAFSFTASFPSFYIFPVYFFPFFLGIFPPCFFLHQFAFLLSGDRVRLARRSLDWAIYPLAFFYSMFPGHPFHPSFPCSCCFFFVSILPCFVMGRLSKIVYSFRFPPLSPTTARFPSLTPPLYPFLATANFPFSLRTEPYFLFFFIQCLPLPPFHLNF